MTNKENKNATPFANIKRGIRVGLSTANSIYVGNELIVDSKFDFRSFYDNQKLFINHQAIVYFREYNFKGKLIKIVYKIKPAN